ncbi:MAG: ribonuclease domain-containing protein, partial [Bacteroidota bacterium]
FSIISTNRKTGIISSTYRDEETADLLDEQSNGDGTVTSLTVSPDDLVNKREEGNFVTGKRTFVTRRGSGGLLDGIEFETTPIGGTAPVGPGRFKKILKTAKIFDQISKRFKNKDGKLPRRDANGNTITYSKADIDRNPTAGQRANGAKRSKRRLLRDSNGKYYYTHDHYKTFRKIKVPKQ